MFRNQGSNQGHDGEVARNPPWWTKDIYQTIHVPFKATVLITDDVSAGPSRVVRLKEKSFLWMKDVVQNPIEL